MTTRILQYSYGGEQPSGIDSYVLEAYRRLDRSQVQFDLLYRYGCPLSARQRADVEALGGRVYALDIDESLHPLARQAQEVVRLWQFFRKHRYSVVEINMTALFMILTAGLLARLHGTRIRIAHAHDALPDEARRKRAIKAIFRPLLGVAATDHWACSAGAARYLFGPRRVRRGDWKLVRNGVDTARFAFDPAARLRVRAEIGLTDELCVGIVGRMTPQKNHLFALDVLAEMRRTAPDAHLLVVGDGPLQAQIRDRVAELGLSDAVILTGVRADVPELLSAMDALLAPSVHEGFPVIGLEAQASGLPCLVSQAFPSESAVTEALTVIPLAAGPRSWARTLGKIPGTNRTAGARRVQAAGYDVGTTATRLQALYDAATSRLICGLTGVPGTDRRHGRQRTPPESHR